MSTSASSPVRQSGNAARRGGLLVVGAVAAASVVVPATAAWANPSGCSNAVSGSTTSIGQLRATATGSCSGNATRTMRAEIKRDRSGYPDALVAANSTTVYGTRYSTSVASCDGGMRATYYGRGFFTSNPTYQDTSHTVQTTCS